jgi:hypothetical protein
MPVEHKSTRKPEVISSEALASLLRIDVRGLEMMMRVANIQGWDIEGFEINGRFYRPAKKSEMDGK